MENFNKIYAQYYAYTYTIVSSIIAPILTSQDAEEITQNIFLKLSQCSYANNDKLIKAFLRRVAVNDALNAVKMRKRKMAKEHTMKVDLSMRSEPTNEPEIKEAELAAMQADVISIIHSEVKKMPKEVLEVFELYYFEQMTSKQIAKKLGIHSDTVFLRLRKASKHLKIRLLFKKDAAQE